MKVMGRTNKFVYAILLGLIVLVAMPTLTFAQGRGRGRGRDKKIEKFINVHDARDGRWDGRGPDWRRRSIFSNRRFRRDRDDDFRFRRVRRIDWDRDGDFDRFDVLQQRRFQRFERRDRRFDRRFDRRNRAWWR